MASRTIQSAATGFDYDGHLMTGTTPGSAEQFTLSYDDNGNMTTAPSATTLVYNWDNKLRSGASGSNSLSMKYDPSGNRIRKQSSVSGARRYIVDIVGDLPVILMEIDPADSSIKKTYIYANSQILAQHNGDYSAARYFYLHDRLGSVREMINQAGTVVNMYTYNPFGETFASETEENVLNPFKYTGQWFDDEVGQYHLRARMYEPHIGRFTTRDPVFGDFKEPLTLHKYLYCGNDPVNRWDLWGLYYTIPGAGLDYNQRETQIIVDMATEIVGLHFIWGPWVAFGAEESWWAGVLGLSSGEKSHGMFDYKYSNLTFALGGYGSNVEGAGFSNYLAGYTTYYNYRYLGLFGAVLAGDIYSLAEYGTYDDWESVLWLTRGAIDANFRKKELGRGLSGQLDEIILTNTKKQYGILGFIGDLNSDNELNFNWFD
jgi:RHS repeat-associated protein